MTIGLQITTRQKWFSIGVGSSVFLFGAFVFIGWAGDIHLLKQLPTGAPPMNPLTALNFVLIGLGLISFSVSDAVSARRFWRWTGYAAVGMTAACALIKLVGYLTGWGQGLDLIFFSERLYNADAGRWNRLAPNTAVNFLMASGALLLLRHKKSWAINGAMLLIVGIVIIAVIALAGHLLKLAFLYDVGTASIMTINTASLFLLVTGGLFFTPALQRVDLNSEAGAKFPLTNKIVLGFIVSVTALLFTTWLSYRTTTGLVTTLESVTHGNEVIATLETGAATLADAESAQTSYLLTGDTIFLTECLEAQNRSKFWVAKLRELTADNSEQQKRTTELAGLIDRRLAVMNNRIQLRQQSGLEAAARAVGAREEQELMAQVVATLDVIRDEEKYLLEERNQKAYQRSRLSTMAIVSSSVMAIVVGGFAFFVIRRDLRLREQMQHELQENRALLESVLDHAPSVVFLKDLQGRYLFVNRQFEQVTGRRRAEIHGKTAYDIASKEVAQSAEALQKSVAEKGAPMELEETFDDPRGVRTYYAVKFPLRDASGQVYATAGISTDITERKRAEEERDRFFTLSVDLLCIASADGYFKRVSPAITDILGWSTEEFLARPLLEFVHEEDRAATTQEIDRQVVSGKRVLHFENRYLHKDGSWRVLSWRSTPLPGGLMFATARDVTERKKVEEEIKILNENLRVRATQLEAANKELEAFSYSVSHDLRAPLRHIDGFVDLLSKHGGDKLDDRGQRYLKIVTSSAQQMGNLIDDLLVFSRMGRAELRHQSVEMEALAHEAIAALQTDWAGRNIEWKIAPLPQVLADAAMMRQVFINLIANAVKYSRPRNPAQIEIGCNGAPTREHVFFVRDNGVGFDMDYVQKLFGVFQRLHRADEFEGTGIGLANVQRIVLRHGGRVWAEGKPNHGATFYFSLPKQSEPEKL